jgi:formate C-acetyltransferase
MYTFRPYTDRIWKYRQKIRDRIIEADAERAQLTVEAERLYKDTVPIIKTPLTTKYIVERMTVRIEDDEIIVGNKAKNFCGSSGAFWAMNGDIEHTWEKRGDGKYYNDAAVDGVALCIHGDELERLRSLLPELRSIGGSAVGDAWLPEGAKEFFELGTNDYGEPGRMGVMTLRSGHLTPGFQKIVNAGYNEIKAEAKRWIDERKGRLMGDDMKKYMFYQAAVYECEAASTFVMRYADLAAEKAKTCADSKRKAELEKMADGLRRISGDPARTYWEACQATELYQLFLSIDCGMPAPAFGRFDQYTWPFLKRELESGSVTLDEAQEITDAFFLKANCAYEGGIGGIAQTTGIGNTYQHTTIGGVIPETGEDAANPVTYMTLETVGRLKLHDPTISLRVNKNTPDELWACALETSKLVGGLPLFQNDEVIIPGLMRELGFEQADARDYSIIGCQEIVGSGTDYPAPNGVGANHAALYYGLILVMAINNGINPLNGKQAPAHLCKGYLYDMKSVEEVRGAYAGLCAYLHDWYVTINNYAEYLIPYNMPQPGLSISMLGCMEKGMDCTEGGCKYNSYGGTATGLATVADSLTAIKYMCFDKKLCTARELYDAVMSDWEGGETLRRRILSEVPHYGNGDPYADSELAFAVNLYYDICKRCSSPRSKVYKAGMYGASDHIAQGRLTPATPDGRKSGEPIADAMSPAQSRDTNGPTAVFASSCCFDHTKFMDGMAVNLRMHPTVLSRDDGIAKLRDLTKAYFNNGGLECQYNVADTETLRAAQASPEDYRDLVVRIAGYSAYFVELGTDQQNDIIARNENRL